MRAGCLLLAALHSRDLSAVRSLTASCVVPGRPAAQSASGLELRGALLYHLGLAAWAGAVLPPVGSPQGSWRLAACKLPVHCQRSYQAYRLYRSHCCSCS